jgi:Co/Zn/Cd efflux system component/copper chaperone CopZ
MKTPSDATGGGPARWQVTGMDCGTCAARIEDALAGVDGIADVHVSLATGVLAARLESTGAEAAVERTVQSLGYGIAPLDATATPPVATHLTPGYRRALWAVVGMNLGYGVVEGVGGFLADSQALKADALDFLGDGLITMLGLVAIGWRTTARARLALLQALFLALLGLAVLVSTGYRVFVQNEPVAGLMGVFGAVALVVNVAAAVVLIPHRAGDASVRAVWLFSRNDAIGNAAVVGAAGVVAWTGSAWPDLLVAVAIAGLFLHAAAAIVQDALRDLRREPPGRDR